jgi:hypothetical protein
VLPFDDQILTREIDVGAGLDLDPGRGLGLVVEAHPGGQWRLAATGDVLINRASFQWDLVVSVPRGQALTVLESWTLEEGDHLRRLDPGAVRIALVTAYGDDPPLDRRADAGTSDAGAGDAGLADPGVGTDGGRPGSGQETSVDAGAVRRGDLDVVVLGAPPGASLMLDVVADRYHDASLVHWVGGGAVRAGAPSNPILFTPVTP